ncbi:MAG: STAS domain-containing protein [Planctomycetota bacterium]|jgi:anti-anti-sigma factor
MEYDWDEADDGILVLAVDAGLNARTAETFVAEVEDLVDRGVRHVVVDCTRLTYLNSYGVSMLIRLHRRLRAGGGGLVVCAVHQLADKVLQASHLDRYFQIHPDVATARAAASAPRG